MSELEGSEIAYSNFLISHRRQQRPREGRKDPGSHSSQGQGQDQTPDFRASQSGDLSCIFPPLSFTPSSSFLLFVLPSGGPWGTCSAPKKISPSFAIAPRPAGVTLGPLEASNHVALSLPITGVLLGAWIDKALGSTLKG